MKMFFLLFLMGLASINITSVASSAIKMAITVDDLPNHGDLAPGLSRIEIARKMITALKKNKVPEVYGFINDSKVGPKGEDRDVLELWTAAGYPLGNHTFSHVSLNDVSISEYKSEIDLDEPALKKLNGKMDWHYFRYPYLHEGNTAEKRTEIRQYLFSKNYKIAPVTVDFSDWAWNKPYTRCLTASNQAAITDLKSSYLKNADIELNRSIKLASFLFKRPISHILLLHIGALDSELLDTLLQQYKKQGVEFISLSEALKDPIYAQDPGLHFDSGGMLLDQVTRVRGLHSRDTGVENSLDYPTHEMKSLCM